MNSPGSAGRGAQHPRLARSATPDLAAAAVATVLLLTTQVGRVASDTKTYLLIDPGRPNHLRVRILGVPGSAVR